jgi:carboxyl-terminal processing protease
LVVLVDWLTASAGEIIALALKEQNWATLVGTQTFGKWSIQTIEDFDDGSSLKYSIGKRYSPSWVNVDKIWITPDFIVDFDSDLMKEKQQDNQLQKAKEIIIQKITK